LKNSKQNWHHEIQHGPKALQHAKRGRQAILLDRVDGLEKGLPNRQKTVKIDHLELSADTSDFDDSFTNELSVADLVGV
jgi:hypothetical protein